MKPEMVPSPAQENESEIAEYLKRFLDLVQNTTFERIEGRIDNDGHLVAIELFTVKHTILTIEITMALGAPALHVTHTTVPPVPRVKVNHG